MCLSLKDENSKETPDIKADIEAHLYGNDILKIQNYLNGSDAIKEISPQFVEDVNIVLEKYQNNTFVITVLKGVVSELLFIELFLVLT